jgi:hypothetical protein
MAQGDANKVWMLPNDFGKALEGFAKALGAPGDDGVFRYEPPAYEPPARRDDEDEEEIATWFDTSTDPKVAEAVRAAEAVARQEVPSPLSTSSSSSSSPPPAVLSRPPLPAGPPEPEPDRPTVVAPAYEPPQGLGGTPQPTLPPTPPAPPAPPARPNESTELSDEPPRYQ